MLHVVDLVKGELIPEHAVDAVLLDELLEVLEPGLPGGLEDALRDAVVVHGGSIGLDDVALGGDVALEGPDGLVQELGDDGAAGALDDGRDLVVAEGNGAAHDQDAGSVLGVSARGVLELLVDLGEGLDARVVVHAQGVVVELDEVAEGDGRVVLLAQLVYLAEQQWTLQFLA